MTDDSRRGILEQIKNPLVFFSLALLMIEGIIGIVVTVSNISGDQQFYSIIIMAVLFFFVIVAVIVITIKWPDHLYEDIKRKVERTSETADNIAEFINSPAFKDVIEDAVNSRVHPDSLVKGETDEQEFD